MNWFQQNRFLGTFLAVLGVATIAALWFLFSARGSFAEARAEFDQTAMELNRLQRLNPFPNETNLTRMRTQALEYADRLEKLRGDLKNRALPVEPMAPDQFQVRLRQAMQSITDRARANKVKLPDNFFLGFDEFAAALPATEAAPLLGQELAQVELLVGMLIDARVEAITALRRVPPAPAVTPTPGPGPQRRPPGKAAAAGPPLVERNPIEVSFISGPVQLRRAINQISTAQQQFYVIRTLHVLNEKTEGPKRDATAATADQPDDSPAAPAAATAGAANKQALNFIVGNERVNTTARIEMLRFTL